MSRRTFIGSLAAVAATGLATDSLAAAPPIPLGMGNYGFKKFKTQDTIKIISDIGYDSIEFTNMNGYDTTADQASPAFRREIRKLVGDHGLTVPCLLDGINLMGNDHKGNLDRIRRNAQFGQDVDPHGKAPIVQTHIGGKDTEWEQQKEKVVERLRDWAAVGKEMKTVVCIKGHNLNLMDTSDKSVWVMKNVDSPWLRIIYDYSHYQASGEELGVTLDRLLPYTAVISLKDGKPNANGRGYERLLPGEGKIDYEDYYRRLLKFGFAGHTVIEISSQIHSRPGYEALPTVKQCYAYVAPIMAKVGVKRPQRQRVTA